MDIDTVRQCFKKFMSYLEVQEKIKIQPFSNEISILEMDKLTQIAFMDYVLGCQKVNQLDRPCVLYKHVNSLIRQYIQEDHSKPIVKVINVGNEFKSNDKKESKSNEIYEKKGWIW